MNKKMLKNSKAGRIICRLLGEETGATMMEYVILAVMIAAAVTVAAIYFGSAAKDQINVATDAMVGNTTDAEARAGSSMSKRTTDATRATSSTQAFNQEKVTGASATGTATKK